MGRRKKPRVLIVDDDTNLLSMMEMLLKRSGYEVHTAMNGIEAMSLIESTKPDLVVLDVVMPLMKGTEVCRRLRSRPETSRLPIIMLSSLDRLDDKLDGFQAGADDYVTKPVDPKELAARINALLVRSSQGKPRSAHTIAVIGAKGGVGVTSVSVNVAMGLAQQKQSVTLAELHTSSGSVAYHVNVPRVADLGSLLALEPEEIKRSEVEGYVVRHFSGVKLLLAPQGAAAGSLTAAHVEAIIGVLQQGSDYLLLDLPAARDEGVRRALELADQILLLTEPESLSVMAARAQLELLQTWHLLERTDVVAVARIPSGTLLTRMELENEMGLNGGPVEMTYHEAQQQGQLPAGPQVLAVIPPAPELYQAAVSAGVPLVLSEPSARAAQALLHLTKALAEVEPEAEGQKL